MTNKALAENEVVAGLDIGGTKMLGVLVDTHGESEHVCDVQRPCVGDTDVRDGVINMLGALIARRTAARS